MNRSNTITIIGLGKLGSPMLACFASKGYNVIGVDNNQNFVDKINKKESPVKENMVSYLLQENSDKIQATTDIAYAIVNSFISFTIVPSPSLEDGSFSTAYVEKVMVKIAEVLKTSDNYHVITIVSTILPGATERMRKLMETISGKTCGKDFGLNFSPDFIALGTVVHDFLNPDMIIIGESDSKAGEILEQVHRNTVSNNPPIYRMSFYNAELTKIAVNSFITMKITFANGIAELCERMPGGNAEIIVKALGADTRIGSKYIKPGLAAMGPCLVRDSRAFGSVAQGFGVTSALAQATDISNRYQKTRIKDWILKLAGTKPVSILGLSYKPFTPVIEESVPVYVALELIKKNIPVRVYDPEALDNTRKEIGDNKLITYCTSIEDCLKQTSLCFVATTWPEFKNIPEQVFVTNMKEAVILDAWNMYNFSTSDIELFQIGKNQCPV